MCARFYSAALGRFLSADPLVVAPGDPQMLDRYAYVRNNPLRYVDPSGIPVTPPGERVYLQLSKVRRRWKRERERTLWEGTVAEGVLGAREEAVGGQQCCTERIEEFRAEQLWPRWPPEPFPPAPALPS